MKNKTKSNFLGLKFVKLAKNEDLVLIHDAARPFVSNQLIENLINKAATHQAVVPYLKQVETTFVTFDEQTIGSYLKREKLFRLQTPQVFNLGLIYQAHSKIKKRALSDDSQILFRLGKPIYYIKGEEENLKVTTENDLKLADKLS